jgi:drug/metabolite transporter (DMT)-like permease
MGSRTYLAPVIAILLGWIILGEWQPWLAFAGGMLCVVGVSLARRRRSRGSCASIRRPITDPGAGRPP